MNDRLLLIMAKNDVNPPIHNDPMEKRNKFIHHTSYLPLALPQGMDLGSGVTEWKPALQGTYGSNMNAFWWVVVKIWTFEKLEPEKL